MAHGVYSHEIACHIQTESCHRQCAVWYAAVQVLAVSTRPVPSAPPHRAVASVSVTSLEPSPPHPPQPVASAASDERPPCQPTSTHCTSTILLVDVFRLFHLNSMQPCLKQTELSGVLEFPWWRSD